MLHKCVFNVRRFSFLTLVIHSKNKLPQYIVLYRFLERENGKGVHTNEAVKRQAKK